LHQLSCMLMQEFNTFCFWNFFWFLIIFWLCLVKTTWNKFTNETDLLCLSLKYENIWVSLTLCIYSICGWLQEQYLENENTMVDYNCYNEIFYFLYVLFFTCGHLFFSFSVTIVYPEVITWNSITSWTAHKAFDNYC
jgi:hypothetical protein